METGELGGHYRGTGTWFDSAGGSMDYRINQTIRAERDDLRISFRHDFDDGSVVDADFVLRPVAPGIYVVRSGDEDIGYGHLVKGVLRYHLRAGDAVVEVSYHPGAPGEIETFGSSTVNADGNYIAWCETLRRGEG